MTTIDKKPNVIAVFTGKSFDHILEVGGSQSWVLDRSNAKHYEYLVCCRSGIDWVEGPEPHGSAFLVGRICDVVPSTEMEGRWLVKISEFAKVNIAKAWKGWRNPVRYTDFEGLGIDPATLVFEPMPEPRAVSRAAIVASHSAATKPLTISEAKRGLAKAFGVSEDAIEITIRG